MNTLRLAPLALMTVALAACNMSGTSTEESDTGYRDNIDGQADQPNMPYEGDQDPEAFFDGSWNVTIVSTTATTPDGVTCGGATAVLVATNGELLGTATTDAGAALTVEGTVGADGMVAGTIETGAGDAGTFEGTMEAATGEGTWEDGFGCEGTFAMIKA